MTIYTTYADLPEDKKKEFNTIKDKINSNYLDVVERHQDEFINAFLNNDAQVEHLNNSKVSAVLWAHAVNGTLGGRECCKLSSEVASQARNALELCFLAYGIESKYNTVSAECIADMAKNNFADAIQIARAIAIYGGKIGDLNSAKVGPGKWAKALCGTLDLRCKDSEGNAIPSIKLSSKDAGGAKNLVELYSLSVGLDENKFKGISVEHLEDIKATGCERLVVKAFLHGGTVEDLNAAKVRPLYWSQAIAGTLVHSSRGGRKISSKLASGAANLLELYCFVYGLDKSKFQGISASCMKNIANNFEGSYLIAQALANGGSVEDLNAARVTAYQWAGAVNGTLGGLYKVSSMAARNAKNTFELYCLSYRVPVSKFQGISDECLKSIIVESTYDALAQALASGARIEDLNNAKVSARSWALAVIGKLVEGGEKISGADAAQAPDLANLVGLCKGLDLNKLCNNAENAFERNESVTFCNIIDELVAHNMVDEINIEDFLYRAKKQHNSTDGMLNQFYTRWGLNDYQFIINHLENLPKHV